MTNNEKYVEGAKFNTMNINGLTKVIVYLDKLTLIIFVVILAFWTPTIWIPTLLSVFLL